MPTQFETGFLNGDLVMPDYIKQYANPINDLESGAALYRVAVDDSGVYQVDFRSSANPDGHTISSLQTGQMIVFKASHPSPVEAELRVLTEGGTGSETYPLFLSDTQTDIGDIKEDQMVLVIFNNTTTPRFDIVGVLGASGASATELNELSDVDITSPTTGEALSFDGTNFVNAVLEIDDVDGLTAALASAGGTPTGHIAELQDLTLSEGDILTANSTGELIKLAPGSNGQVLTISSGIPAWGEGGGGGGDWLISRLVAHGKRYTEITSTSQDLRSSPFTPVTGRHYLIRWIANHTASSNQINVATAITYSQDHFCRAVETGDSTIHNIGFSGSTATDYVCTLAEQVRTHEFVWTASTDAEVEIVFGQPSLLYGEFTGTILVYELQEGVINLGWGTFGPGWGYSWLANSANATNSLSGGSYMSGVALDAGKTYAFIGNWNQGYSIKLVLRQGSNYWRLPTTSDTWAVASGGDNAWEGGIYYNGAGNTQQRGEFVRLFSPPSTGTFELGCGFFGVGRGCFWLVELPT